MAYNNYFPAGYMPQYYYPQNAPTQPIQQQQNTSGIVWVQGESGAKSYLVAPNTTVSLWDSESQTIYLKSADASGMPSLKILDYTIRDAMPVSQPNTQTTTYVTKNEFEAFKNEVQKMMGGAKNESIISTDEQSS